MSSNEDNNIVTPGEPPRKKIRNEHKYTVIRDCKVRGEEHTTHRTNQTIPAREIGPDCQ